MNSFLNFWLGYTHIPRGERWIYTVYIKQTVIVVRKSLREIMSFCIYLSSSQKLSSGGKLSLWSRSTKNIASITCCPSVASYLSQLGEKFINELFKFTEIGRRSYPRALKSLSMNTYTLVLRTRLRTPCCCSFG